MISKLILIVFFLTISFLKAQDYPWTITLVNDETISNVTLQSLNGDSLLIASVIGSKWVNIKSITVMKKIVKSKIFIGMTLGFVVGATTGAIINNARYEKPEKHSDWDYFNPGLYIFGGGVVGGVIGMAAGGGIGALVSTPKYYILAQYEYEDKIKLIESFLSK